MRPADLDFRDLLLHRYARRRKTLLQTYRDLLFEAVAVDGPALEALNYVIYLQDQFKRRVRAIQETIKQETLTAPLAHLKRTRWKRHALDGDKVNPHYYEMAAWQRLKDDLRAGDIAVTGSRRYQAFDGYLFSTDEWETLKSQNQT